FEDPESLDYELVGNYRFNCLPGASQGDRVRVTFHYDISGIPTVEAVDVASGKPMEQKDRLHDYKDPNPEQVVVRLKPRWVIFAVDVSISMEGEKLTNARQALVDRARKLLRFADWRVGIVSFGSHATVVCPPTAEMAQVERAAASLAVSGSTAM